MSLRRQALDQFEEAVSVPRTTRMLQRGRDPQDAQFALELDDGRLIPLGTIDTLWSRSKLSQVLAVRLGTTVQQMKPAEYQEMIGLLIAEATDVDEALEGSEEEETREWLRAYAGQASRGDHLEAAAGCRPYIRDNHLWVHAGEMRKYLARSAYAPVDRATLVRRVRQVGFEPARVTYPVRGGDSKSSASYWHGPLEALGYSTDEGEEA